MGRREGPTVRIHGQGGDARLGLVQGNDLVGAAVAREDAPVRQAENDGVRLSDDDMMRFVCARR